MCKCEERSSMTFTLLIMVIYSDWTHKPKLVQFSWGISTRSKASLLSSEPNMGNCSLEVPLIPQTVQEASLKHLNILGWAIYFTVWINNVTGHEGASGTSVLVYKDGVRFPWMFFEGWSLMWLERSQIKWMNPWWWVYWKILTDNVVIKFYAMGYCPIPVYFLP